MSKKSRNDQIPPNTPGPRGIDLTFEKGLPQDLLAEKSVLGAILKGGLEIFTGLTIAADDFALEKHKRLFLRMGELAARAEKIDRVTVAGELGKHGQLESVDGLTYLLELDEFLPGTVNVDAYVRAVQEKARLRKLIFSFQKGIDQALIAEAESTEIAGAVNQKLSEIQASAAVGERAGQSPLQVVEAFPGGINAFLDPTQRMRGLPTGFKKIDEMIGGLKGGEVYIVAARPSVGKTAWCMNVVQHLATDPSQGRVVSVFNLEMSAESLLLRMACAGARVDQHKMRLGFLNSEERHRLQVALADLTDEHTQITFYDKLVSMPDITRAIRQDVKKGMHLAVVDYLQLIQPPSRASDNQNLAMQIISREFKLLSKELDIPLIILSQLSRQSERRTDSRPQLADLRDSGAIEQDADLVGFLYREELYRKDRDDLKGLAEFIIAKQRNGPIGKVHLRFIHQFVKFEDRSDEPEPPEGN